MSSTQIIITVIVVMVVLMLAAGTVFARRRWLPRAYVGSQDDRDNALPHARCRPPRHPTDGSSRRTSASDTATNRERHPDASTNHGTAAEPADRH
jgi:hypothetical protein